MIVVLSIIIIIMIYLIIYEKIIYKKNGLKKEEYKEIIIQVKNKKINQILKSFFVIISILLVLIIIIGFFSTIMVVGMSFFTLFGTAYVDTGHDPSLYVNIGGFLSNLAIICLKSTIYLIYVWIIFLILKIFVKHITSIIYLKKINN